MRAIYLLSSVCCLKVKGLIVAAILLVVFHRSSTIICLILINLAQTEKVTVQFNRQIEKGREQPQPGELLVQCRMFIEIL